MSFLSRLFAKAPAVEEACKAAEVREPKPWQALRMCGLAEGPEHELAVELIAMAQSEGQERDAIELLLAACAHHPVSESLRMRLAGLLSDRAEFPLALSVLKPCVSTAALILLSDLHYDAGNRHHALATIERVLAREIDAPGARERYQRWQERKPKTQANDTTLSVPAPTQSAYRIIREVARGGCGTIYEGFDDDLMRPIAFKVYHRPKEDRDQLLRECRTAVRFAGTGVVRVFDANPEEGWIALQWVANGSIRDCLARKRFESLGPARTWARALALCLARIHRAGFVHADIKPANILLQDAQTPILTDFGIAAEQGTLPTGGSRGYLSPERLAGRTLTASDDIYAYGRVLEDVVEQLAENAKDDFVQRVMRQCLGSEQERPKNGDDLIAAFWGNFA